MKHKYDFTEIILLLSKLVTLRVVNAQEQSLSVLQRSQSIVVVLQLSFQLAAESPIVETTLDITVTRIVYADTVIQCIHDTVSLVFF